MAVKVRMSEEEAVRRGLIPPPAPVKAVRPFTVNIQMIDDTRKPPHKPFLEFKQVLVWIAWWFFGIFLGLLFK